MEFYSHAAVKMAVADIQRNIVVSKLPEWCESIVKVHTDQKNQGKISCLSGDFVVHRELLNEGVRFSMPAGPHAIQWTITTAGENDVLVHCTINTAEPDPAFVENLEHFIANWRAGLEDWPLRLAAEPGAVCIACGDSYGGFG